MEIVIEISEKLYKALKQDDNEGDAWDAVEAILSGKPLPKGHGRLIGADELKAEVFRACMDKYFMPTKFLDCDTITEIIDNAQTIIEADKGVNE